MTEHIRYLSLRWTIAGIVAQLVECLAMPLLHIII